MLQELLNALEKELELVARGNGREFTLLNRHQRADLRETTMRIPKGLAKLNNTLTPINRLPPEILASIPTYRARGRDRISVVTLSQVCSYWRDTFLTTPSLWTGFNGKNAKMSQVFIERSGALPIQLEVHGDPDLNVLKLLVPHFPRLDVITFRHTSNSLDPIMEYYTNMLRPSSLLRVINISGPSSRTVPMHGDFPSLNFLRVINLGVSINDVRVPNLRVLYLATDYYDLTSLIDFLDTCPLLETLELHLGNLGGKPPDICRKVVWEKLKTLALSGRALRVLRHISLPLGAEANLSALLLLDCADDDNMLDIQSLCHLPFFLRSESLSLRLTTGQVLSLKGPNGNLSLKTAYHSQYDYIMLLVSFARPSVNSIENLELHGVRSEHPIPPSATNLLTLLESLRFLKLVDTDSSPWIHALGRKNCPRLWRLTFCRSPPPSCEDLIRFVMDRRDAGVPIHGLSVTKDVRDLFHTREDVEKLENCVQSVEWDMKQAT